MLFVNTRPADRAVELTTALLQQNIPVLELPLLELIPYEWSWPLEQQYQQLVGVDVIVVVSPMAVQLGMHYLQKSGIQLASLSAVKWIAVGEKTAQLLKQYGIYADVPQIETSEGMLALPILQHLDGSSTVAFWRGEGGRQFMMDAMRRQGLKILNMLLYYRQCPAQTSMLVVKFKQYLRTQPHYNVLISSEASWLNWLNLFSDDLSIIDCATYMVLGERLLQLLQQYKLEQKMNFSIVQLEQLKSAYIVAELHRGRESL